MKLRRALGVYALVLHTTVAISVDPPAIPEAWVRFLRLDREYNLRPAENPREPVSDKDRAVVPIYHVDVPEGDEVTVTRSKYLDRETADRFLHGTGRIRTVRLFFLDRAEAEKFGKVRQEYWGTKFQSHATYFVWNPRAKDEPPVALKFRLQPGQSVANNDYVEDHMGPEAAESLMTERLEVRATRNGAEAKYVVRSLELVTQAQARGNELVPLHGFMGSPDGVAAAARARGVTTTQWLETEYLPKLARFLARQSVKHGVHIEAHSQNILFELDPRTGQIVRFGFRDLWDILPDPAVSVLAGRSPRTQRLRSGSYDEVNRSFGTEATNHSWLGRHFEAYGSQSVLEIGHRLVRERSAALFLDEYIKAVETLTGVKVKLSKEAADHLRDFRDGDSQELHRRAMGVVMQSIHDDLRTQLAQKRWNPRVQTPLAEDTAAWEMVERLLKRKQVALFFRDSRQLLERHFAGAAGALRIIRDPSAGGIAIYDASKDTVIAFAYDLSEAERAHLGMGRHPALCDLEAFAPR